MDDSCEIFNRTWTDVRPRVERCAAGLDDAIRFTSELFGPDAFRKPSQRGHERPRNRAVLDVMAFYFQHAQVREEVSPRAAEVRSTFEELCRTDPEFEASLTSTTKSVGAVFGRLIQWGTVLNTIAPSVATFIPERPE
jgi:hypothetical protein